MLLVRLLFGVPTPAELFGDRLTQLIPLSLFSALLTFFGPNAKHLFYAALVVAQGIGMAVLAAAYWGARVAWRARVGRADAHTMPETGYADGAALAALSWLIAAGVLAPLVGGGPLGSQFTGGALGLLSALLTPALVAAAVFVGWQRRTARLHAAEGAGPDSPTRRRLLRQAGFALAVLAGTAAAWALVERGAQLLGLGGYHPPTLDLGPVPDRISPPPVPTYGAWTPVAGESAEITPTSRFYYVSKNLVSDPSIDAAGWRLALGGMVEQPATLTYDQLRALPSVDQYQTLECISNEVGGNLISNARWTGVRLTDLLQQAGIQVGASELVFRCADGYSDRLHLAQALGPRAMVAYLIDGQPLPQPHGFPARLLVPGLYGMKNGKWLTELAVDAGDYTGYWEQQGWSREAVVKTMARIDVPTDGDLLAPRPTVIAGVAFAGDRGIAQVDVSVDGGRTWSASNLKRPLAQQSWVLWELPWQATAGTHVLVARAVDGEGFVQAAVQTPPLPDGATGYHAITVHVG
jgi:DMSO/TMAO reductase YedYZ molybdopterin-dependent catalytic subunit